VTYIGTVRGDVIVLEERVPLPNGAKVEVRLIEPSDEVKATIGRIRARRQRTAGVRIGLNELLQESRQELEAR